MNKKGLGKGLGAIFGENPNPMPELEITEEAAKAAMELETSKIRANPYQPRRNFDAEKLNELAASIKEFGIVQPLIVRRSGDGYELVAGERRLRAAKLAGLKTVPALIRDYDDAKLMEIALVENIQRHDLSPIEEARGLKRLISEFKLTQEQAADKVGRSRVAVTNILRLLNLPEEIQGYISSGTMSMGQAKQLLGLKDKEQQLKVAEAIIEGGWSARMTEEVIRRLKEGKQIKISREIIEEIASESGDKEGRKRKPRPEKDVYTRDFEERLIELLGTKVKVVPRVDEQGRKGGTIQIEYYSSEDLERIYEVLQQGGEKETPDTGAAPARFYV